MKKIILTALVAVTAALGFLYRQLTRETTAKEAEAAAAKRKLLPPQDTHPELVC